MFERCVAFSLLFGFACLSGACASGPRAVESQGKETWYRVAGPSFTVYTDLNRERALSVASELERNFEGMLLGWEAKGRPKRHVQVVVFANDTSFREFGGDNVDGYYREQLFFSPWAFTFANSGFETFKHELTHFIAFQAIPNEPVWFAEGIATYFQTAHFEREIFAIGQPPYEMIGCLRQKGPMPASELFAIDSQPSLRGYATAWLLTHYFMHEQSDAFARYQSELVAGVGYQAAWDHAFPGMTPEIVDDRLKRYFDRNQFALYSFDANIPTPQLTATQLSAADVHALYALTEVGCVACENAQPRIEAHIASALKSDPQNFRANLVQSAMFTKDHALQAQRAQALTQAHPEEWTAWLLLGSVQNAQGTIQADWMRGAQAFDRAAELGPNEPIALISAAAGSAGTGDMKRALRLSRQAVGLDPSNASVFEMRAKILDAAHACPELNELTERTNGLLFDHPNPELKARLRLLREQCVPAPTPAQP